jgi:hypothetical protein
LDVPDDLTERHHQIVAECIKLGAEHFHIGNVSIPKQAKGFANENMLNDPLAKRRVFGMR